MPKRKRQGGAGPGDSCPPFLSVNIFLTRGYETHLKKGRSLSKGWGEAKGTTLSDLKRIAEDFGLHAIPIECDISHIGQLGHLGVLHVNNNHFIAVSSIFNDGFQAIDFPSPPIILKNELDARISAKVKFLLLSKDPINIKDAKQDASISPLSSLHFDTEEINLGRISCNLETAAKFINSTTHMVRIKQVKKSCSCLEAIIDRNVLDPGSYSTLRIKINYEKEQYGPFKHTIIIQCDSTNTTSTAISISGVKSFPIIADPTAITFNNLLPGEQAFADLSILTDIPQDKLTFEPMPENYWLRFLPTKKADMLSIRCTWLGSKIIGWQFANALIREKDSSRTLCRPIPLAVNVIPFVETKPTALQFRADHMIDPLEKEIRIIIRRPSKAATVKFMDKEFENNFKLDYTELDRFATLRISTNRLALSALQNKHSNICIRFNEGDQISVPVYILGQ